MVPGEFTSSANRRVVATRECAGYNRCSHGQASGRPPGGWDVNPNTGLRDANLLTLYTPNLMSSFRLELRRTTEEFDLVKVCI
jgi:hypothetical protein